MVLTRQRSIEIPEGCWNCGHKYGKEEDGDIACIQCGRIQRPPDWKPPDHEKKAAQVSRPPKAARVPQRKLDQQAEALLELYQRQPPTMIPIEERRYPTDVDNAEWRLIESLIPSGLHGGRPRKADVREVVNAALYLTRNQTPWRKLPGHFPPWKTVYDYFNDWRKTGTWESIEQALSDIEAIPRPIGVETPAAPVATAQPEPAPPPEPESKARPPREPRKPGGLSRREVEVLDFIDKGMRNRDIAAALDLSVRTVEVHIRNIFDKLGVSNRSEAVIMAQKGTGMTKKNDTDSPQENTSQGTITLYLHPSDKFLGKMPKEIRVLDRPASNSICAMIEVWLEYPDTIEIIR